MEGRHYEWMMVDDSINDSINNTSPWDTLPDVAWGAYQISTHLPHYADSEMLQKIKELSESVHEQLNKNKEMDIMFLYRVYLIYAADRKKPQIITTGSTVAANDEDAKIKSGVYQKIDSAWDADYITIVAEKVAEVKVKAKAQEVKQV